MDTATQVQVILEKLTNIQASIMDIQGHLGRLNDEGSGQAIQFASLVAKMDIFEKLMWIIIAATVTAMIGSVWSIILSKRNSNGKNQH